MIKVGLTGGIGVGKSYVSQVFRAIGVPVYDADSSAKILMNTHDVLKTEIIRLLGEKAYCKNGLDRRFVADKVFNDSELLTQLNSLVHPIVYKDFDDWSLKQSVPVVMKESALLLKGGDKKGLDKVILVDASLETRIKRIQKRDSFRTFNEIKAIIEKQGDLAQFSNLIDFRISNNDNEMLVPQIVFIKEELELTSFT